MKLWYFFKSLWCKHPNLHEPELWMGNSDTPSQYWSDCPDCHHYIRIS